MENLTKLNHCFSQDSVLPVHIWRSDRLNFRSFPTAQPKRFTKPVIQFSLKTVFKKGDICLKGLELFQDQRVVKNVRRLVSDGSVSQICVDDDHLCHSFKIYVYLGRFTR